jgi:hypothetical protein
MSKYSVTAVAGFMWATLTLGGGCSSDPPLRRADSAGALRDSLASRDSLAARDSLASPDSLHWKTLQTETFTLRYPPNADLEDAEGPAEPPGEMIVGPLSHGPDGAPDYYVMQGHNKNRAHRPLREWVDSVVAHDGSSMRNAEKTDTVRVRDLIFIRNRSVSSTGGPMETFG